MYSIQEIEMIIALQSGLVLCTSYQIAKSKLASAPESRGSLFIPQHQHGPPNTMQSLQYLHTNL
jgi:hypothetical protein